MVSNFVRNEKKKYTRCVHLHVMIDIKNLIDHLRC